MLYAGPICEVNPALTKWQTQAAITALPDWQNMASNRAAYVADKQDYTNKVAQVSDATTKQAIRAQATCVQDLQAQISDLKRVVLAIANATTNSAALDQ